MLQMARKRIEMIKEIFNECSGLVYKSLEEIPEEQINWRPAPESRSIFEITAHLIRVNIYFMKRLGYEITIQAPKNNSIDDLNISFKAINLKIIEILDSLQDDSDLRIKSIVPDAKDIENLNQLIPHLSQHYLYHYSQMVYLRRAQNRQWISPVEEWERITYLIGNYLNPLEKV